MSVPDDLKELHDATQLLTDADALELVSTIVTRTEPGDVVTLFLDDDRRIVELFHVTGGAEPLLPKFVEMTCSLDEPDVTGLLIVTDRSGEIPLDRPDDELVWQELVDTARSGGVTLYDWFVVADHRWAFSVAEFSPTPAQW